MVYETINDSRSSSQEQQQTVKAVIGGKAKAKVIFFEKNQTSQKALIFRI